MVSSRDVEYASSGALERAPALQRREAPGVPMHWDRVLHIDLIPKDIGHEVGMVMSAWR